MIEQQTTKEDLSLSNLNQFSGTEQYHNIGSIFSSVNVTDGIIYIMKKGYSWFVTDFLSLVVLQHDSIKNNMDFLTIKLKLSDSKADMVVTDGNEKQLYTQHYKYTNVKSEVTLFYIDGVLLLSGEY